MSLELLNQSDTQLLFRDFSSYGYHESRLLEPGEHIIGVYGSKNRQFCDYIDTLGFIVWKQPFN